jgi:hypothetical protein
VDQHNISAELEREAARTALSRYLLDRLIRNPFVDATRITREFVEAGAKPEQAGRLRYNGTER